MKNIDLFEGLMGKVTKKDSGEQAPLQNLSILQS